MKKLLSIISIVLVGMGLSHAQVGIGTDNPQGALDLNPENGPAKWGLVLPVVPTADTASLGRNLYPSVTTPTSAFITITTTDDEGGTSTLLVPKEEAPAGTIVFDILKDGIRVKQTSKNVANDPNGDWCDDRLADETGVSTEVDRLLYGGTDFKMKDASAGYQFSIGISREDTLVYGIGYNYAGRVGVGTSSGYTRTWTMILGNAGPARQVSAGYYHGAAVMNNGDAYTWGYNYLGRTGLGTTSGYTLKPTKVNIALDAGDKIKQAEAGYYNTLFLTEKGKVYAAGYAYYGILGDGSTSGYSAQPKLINFSLQTGEIITQISLGYQAAAAVTSEGRVFTWGYNSYGATGQGSTSGRTGTPTLVSGIPTTAKIIQVAMGGGSGLALVSDSVKLYHWGTNRAIGGSGNALTPTLVSAPLTEGEKIVSIAAPRLAYYYYDSNMILTTKTVYTAGYNNSPGKLGVINEDNGNYLNFIPTFREIVNHTIYEGTRYTKGSIGYNHAFIMTGELGDGSLQYANYTTYGSGYNYYNQLGGGSTGGWRFFTAVKK